MDSIASLTHLHVVRIEVLYHILFQTAIVALASPYSINVPLVCEGRLNGKTIRIVENSSPFEQAKAHLVETMFYDEWVPSGESSMSKPSGTFLPGWEDIENDPEADLRELLE